MAQKAKYRRYFYFSQIKTNKEINKKLLIVLANKF